MKLKFIAIPALAFLIACNATSEDQAEIGVGATNEQNQTESEQGDTGSAIESTEPFVPEDTTLTVVSTYEDVNIYAEEFQYFLNLNVSQEEEFLFHWLGMNELAIAEYWEEESLPGLTNRQRIHQDTWEEVTNRATLRYIAISRGYGVTPELEEEAQRNLQDFVDTMRFQGEDPEEFFYEAAGITLSTFALLQLDMMIINNFVMSFVENFEISEAQAMQFFEENREQVEEHLGMLASTVHILVDTREEAEALLARLEAGERARDLAPIYSQDPGVVQDEGAYHFPRGQMVAPFEEWSFNANAGDTGIVESQFGYHVMYSEGRETLQDSDHIENLKILASQDMAGIAIDEMIEQSNINF
ncbi:MAG: peptidylprolyl isomerase, partial [Defluviitaleaceae bacterium]|nr:peptidylprolyl isomerase [Defluviitaleaceae bacterium]